MKKKEILSQTEFLLKREYKTPNLNNKTTVVDEIIFLSLCIKSGHKNVDTAYKQLTTAFDNWDKALESKRGKIAYLIKVSGNSRTKERIIREILEDIKEKANGFDLEFLNSYSDQKAYEWLVSIKNVGPKIANCVLLFVLNRDVFPVDTHIYRILRRLDVIDGNIDIKDVTPNIQLLIENGKSKSLHVNLIEHGRNVCKVISPKCRNCGISHICAYAGNHVIVE